jgi:PmbA protein
MSIDPRQIAESTLERMQSAGFDDSHVSVTASEQDELNVSHNEASLLRSTENYGISLLGILDGRRASATLTDLSEDAIGREVASLAERVKSAPQDPANAVSSAQSGHFEQGPLDSDLDLLADKVRELLDYRNNQAGKVTIDEGAASHFVSRSHEVTSQGTALSSVLGCQNLMVMCTATEGERSSSFNYTGGSTHDLGEKHASEWFAVGDMLSETERQIDTHSFDAPFKGGVILAPGAVSDLVGWLLQQLSSGAMIADSSVYKDSVGERIAAPALSVRSYTDAPGHTPFTGDGFRTEPIQLLDEGRLTTLLLDLYGSRKTGLPHTPSPSAWRIDPGSTSKAELIGSIERGALVSRFSMGAPAANGDFSGVIKNSFKIEGGEVGSALSETMVAGNMARMLLDIDGISKEHIDYGGEDYPWLRISGLHFS